MFDIFSQTQYVLRLQTSMSALTPFCKRSYVCVLCVDVYSVVGRYISTDMGVRLQPYYVLTKKCKPSTIILYLVYFSYSLSHGTVN